MPLDLHDFWLLLMLSVVVVVVGQMEGLSRSMGSARKGMPTTSR